MEPGEISGSVRSAKRIGRTLMDFEGVRYSCNACGMTYPAGGSCGCYTPPQTDKRPLHEEIERLRARLAEAERLLRFCVENTECGELHHDPHEYHKFGEACPVMNRLNAFLADQPSAAPSPCNWHADYEGAWESDCGLVWCLLEGRRPEEDVPSKNEMAFCPKCGKPLVEHPYVDPPTCDECGEELQDGKCPDGCTPDKGDAAHG